MFNSPVPEKTTVMPQKCAVANSWNVAFFNPLEILERLFFLKTSQGKKYIRNKICCWFIVRCGKMCGNCAENAKTSRITRFTWPTSFSPLPFSWTPPTRDCPQAVRPTPKVPYRGVPYGDFSSQKWLWLPKGQFFSRPSPQFFMGRSIWGGWHWPVRFRTGQRAGLHQIASNGRTEEMEDGGTKTKTWVFSNLGFITSQRYSFLLPGGGFCPKIENL